MPNKKIRDENGRYAKKGLYLTENCRKCKFIEDECEGIFAVKGATILSCLVRQNLKSKEKAIGRKIKQS